MKNISISMKMLIIAFIPTAVAIFFGVWEINMQNQIKSELTTINKLMNLSSKFSSLIHELQAERGMSAGFISSKGSEFSNELPNKKTKTDSAISELQTYYFEIKEALDSNFTAKVDEALSKLSALGEVREQVTGSTASNYTVKEAVTFYSSVNQTLLSIIPEITKLSSNAEIARELAAFSAFINGKEFAGLERAGLSVAFTRDLLQGAAMNKFLEQLHAQENYFKTFKSLANNEMLDFFDTEMKAPSIAAVEKMRALAMSKTSSYNQDAGEWFDASTKRINVLKKIEDFIAGKIVSKANTLLDKAASSVNTTVMTLFISIIMVSIIVYLIRRKIVNSLNRTIHILKDIAEGDGQLHKRLQVESFDEIGLMSEWFNKFISKIEAIVSEIQEKAVQLAENASDIAAVSSQMDQKMKEMNLQSQSVASAVEQLTVNISDVSKIANNMHSDSKSSHDESEKVSNSMQEINSSLDKSQNSISSIASSSEQMSAIITEIAANTEQSRSVSSDAVSVVNHATTQVEELAQSSNEIVQVIDMIAEISDQTKNLALNATIEAARAGEAGKGFAVVASEVKELARGTMEATESIRNTVQKMNSSTTQTVTEIKKVNEIIVQISQMTNSISSAIEEQSTAISQNSEETQLTAELLKEVFNSIRESIEGVNHIANSVGSITNGAQDVSNNTSEAKNATTEVAERLVNINAGINENTKGINSLSSSSQELAGYANELKLLVNQFEVNKSLVKSA